MTKVTRGVLYYLGRYIEADKRRENQLRTFYKKRTGDELNRGNLWRHLHLKTQPLMDGAIVYLAFLQEAGELLPGKRGEGLFFFAHPELLKEKGKK